MQLNSMKTALQRYGFDTTDPLTQWLNWGMWEVEKAHDWWFLYYQELISINAGDASISLTNLLPAGSIKRINTIRLLLPSTQSFDDPLEYITAQDWARKTTTLNTNSYRSAPRYYSIRVNPVNDMEVPIWPFPSVAYTAEVTAKVKDPAMSDAAPTVGPAYIPDTLEAAIITRAAAFGLMAENEESRASDALNQFDNLIKAEVTDSDKVTGPQYVQDVMNYGC